MTIFGLLKWKERRNNQKYMSSPTLGHSEDAFSVFSYFLSLYLREEEEEEEEESAQQKSLVAFALLVSSFAASFVISLRTTTTTAVSRCGLVGCRHRRRCRRRPLGFSSLLTE